MHSHYTLSVSMANKAQNPLKYLYMHSTSHEMLPQSSTRLIARQTNSRVMDCVFPQHPSLCRAWGIGARHMSRYLASALLICWHPTPQLVPC